MKHNFARKIVLLVMTAALIIPLVQPAAVTDVSAKKVTQSEINKLKENAASLAQQKKDLKNQLKAIKADKNEAQNKKSVIEQQMGVIQDEIDNIDGQIAGYSLLIGEKSQDIADTQAKEAEQYRLFCARVRAMEEDGQTSYWSILFSSDTFSDLLDNFMMVQEIVDYDNAVMNDLIATRNKIEGEKAELENLKTERETARQEQVAAKQELSTRQSEVDSLIKEISAQEGELEAQEAALRKAANAVDAEIKRMEKEMAQQIQNVPSESGFLWPLNGYDTLTSLYGGRIHPITHKPHNHTGIDIPAPGGTPILASKSGVVTTSTYMKGGYGNYVVVSHSDGTSTLYAHMSSRLAKKGQTVKQGQVIGKVGTTGRSTGNHLHFEIRVNGSRRDPIDYFKSKTLYVRSGGQKVVLKH